MRTCSRRCRALRADAVRSCTPDLRLPRSRALGAGLFELRPRGRSGLGRAFYCFASGRLIVVVHAFAKKTAKTPDREVVLARKRVKEILKWLN
ncbi:MAG TPA: type II toxin-antitoxin system RelE/ParE family toxin [Gammaproteobacteria bacterium]|nr:type II toxin-antitoxin system RelE/ParE family toxin [Gammaproteobacteria bacterium]